MSPVKLTTPVVIVGSGLAGLTTGNQLLKKKIPIILLDKASSIGGNSIKASSGINGIKTSAQASLSINDSEDLFFNDTFRSAKGLGSINLMNRLVNESSDALAWLQQEFGLKLDLIAQLGGHSIPRTHRSSGKLPPGFEIVSALKNRLEVAEKNNPASVKILLNSKATNIEQRDGKVTGLKYVDINGDYHLIKTSNIIFCSGGFGFSKDMLEKYAHSLKNLPTTNGQQTTGDGQKLLHEIGGQLIDMDQIQVHPTGFVDPFDPDNNFKFLAAEALRGLGGILINPLTGLRFVNELDTRDNVTNSIEKYCIGETKTAYLVMSEKVYDAYKDNMNFYLYKNLIKKISLSEFIEDLPISEEQFVHELHSYSSDKEDKFGRSSRINSFEGNINSKTTLFVGKITPVVHFTMGGIKVNDNSQVLDANDNVLLDGLYAVGEVTGGVHGSNRLGGSSLLECVVFGRHVANYITNLL